MVPSLEGAEPIRTLAGCSVDWPFSSQLQNRPQVVDKLRRNRSHIDGRTR